MVLHHLATVLENESHKPSWDFEIQTDYPEDQSYNNQQQQQQKMRTCRIVDFAVPADHTVN